MAAVPRSWRKSDPVKVGGACAEATITRTKQRPRSDGCLFSGFAPVPHCSARCCDKSGTVPASPLPPRPMLVTHQHQAADADAKQSNAEAQNDQAGDVVPDRAGQIRGNASENTELLTSRGKCHQTEMRAEIIDHEPRNHDTFVSSPPAVPDAILETRADDD